MISGAKGGDWRERYHNMNKINIHDDYCCLVMLLLWRFFEGNDDDEGNVGDGKG